MNINRRAFVTTGVTVASTLAKSASSMAAPNSGEFEAIRSEFPRAVEQVNLDAAANTPLPKYTAEGMRKYMDFHMYGPAQGRAAYADEALRQVKALFAKLVNAKPSEIGFVAARGARRRISLCTRRFAGYSGKRFDLPGLCGIQLFPWVARADPGKADFPYEAQKDAGRCEPGNVSYVALPDEAGHAGLIGLCNQQLQHVFQRYSSDGGRLCPTGVDQRATPPHCQTQCEAGGSRGHGAPHRPAQAGGDCR